MNTQHQSRCGRLILWQLVFFAALSLNNGARAELPLARLTAVAPPGGKQGTSVEISLTGQDLEGVNRLHFSNPGIIAKPKSSTPADARKFIVEIGANVAPGYYDIRAIGRYGVTNPRTFVVGMETEIAAKPGNITPETAIELSANSAVDSIAEANAAHFYRLPLKRGEPVWIEVETARIDSKMQAIFIVSAPDGREIAHSLRGEPIAYVAAVDGVYQIKIVEVLYRGGPEYFYRLAVTQRPRLQSIMPPVALAEDKVKPLWVGADYDDGGAANHLVLNSADGSLLRWPAPAASAFLNAVAGQITTAKGLSNSVLLLRVSAPVVLDSELAHATPERAQNVTVPCIIGGQFHGSEPKWFVFTLSPGSFGFEVISQRLGEVTAPLLILQRLDKDASGQVKAMDVQESFDPPAGGSPEFSTASRDPACRVDVKEAGTYRIALRNLFRTAADMPSPVFTLVMRHETPDFRLVAVPASPLPDPKDSKDVPIWSTLLRRGGVTPIQVVVQRIDGFSGEIKLNASGLPAGVTAAPASIAAGATSGTLLLAAAPGTAGWVGPITIAGTAQIAGRNEERKARFGTVSLSNYDKQNKRVEVRSRVTAEYLIAVSDSEDSPLAIAPTDARIFETCIAGKLSIPLKITRRAGLTGPISIKLAGHPVLVAAKEITVDAKADTASIDLDLAQLKFASGQYALHVEVQAKVKYGKVPETPKAGTPPKLQTADVIASFYSTPFTVRVLPAPITFDPVRAVQTTAGMKIEVPVAINRLFNFVDPVAIKLIVPADVKDIRAVDIALAKDQSQGKLVIEADPTAAPRQFTAKLQAKVKFNNQELIVEQDVAVKIIPKPAN